MDNAKAAEASESYVKGYENELRDKVEHVLDDLNEREDSDSEEEDHMHGDAMVFSYPRLPPNMDFETYRKNYKTWKEIIAYYNGPALKDKNTRERKNIYRERFVSASWPRGPNCEFIGEIPEGKHTNNGEHTTCIYLRASAH